MPNHVHVLLQPFEPPTPPTEPGVTQAGSLRYASDEIPDARSPLSAIMHSLKS